MNSFLKYSIAGLTILLVSVFSVDSLAQDTLIAQIPVLKDNTLYEDSGGIYSNGQGSYFFAGRTAQLNNTIRRGLLAFDVFGYIPGGSQIISAELTVRMSRTIAGATDVNLHRILADWGESTSDAPGSEGVGDSADFGDATWLHTFYDFSFWNTPGGDFEATSSATTSVSGIAFYTFGSTNQMRDDVQLWLDDPDTNFGWIVIGDESQPATAKRFDSGENGNMSNRPVLVVTYVPPPCCIGDRGDVNNDGTDANILDLNFLVNRIFRFGPAPACGVEADVNSDGNSANILDLNYLVNRIFRNGPAPGPC